MSKEQTQQEWLKEQQGKLYDKLLSKLQERPKECSKHLHRAPAEVVNQMLGLSLTEHQVMLIGGVSRAMRDVFVKNPELDYKFLHNHAEWAEKFRSLYGDWDNNNETPLTRGQMESIKEMVDFDRASKYIISMRKIDTKIASDKKITAAERTKARAARKHEFYKLVNMLSMFTTGKF